MTEFQRVTLGDILTFQRGFDITKTEQSDGVVPIVSSSGISSYHNKWKVRGPGLVIGRKGTLGTVHYIRGDFWPHDTTLWVKDFKGNSPVFLRYFLQTLKLENFDVGASNPTVNRNHLHKIKVIFPRTTSLQSRIAAILSAYDDLIEVNRRGIELLEQVAEEIYREWFVRLRFPGHERTVMSRGVPDGWDVIPFSKLVIVNPQERVDRGQELPFVGMEDLSVRTMFCASKEVRKGGQGAKFRNRDVLFPRITPSVENGKRGFVMTLEDGQVGFGSTEFIVLREKTLDPEHIYFLTCSAEFRKHAELSMTGASGRQRVQEECFSFFLVKTPPPEIRGQFREVIRPHFRQIHLLSRQIDHLTRARDLLLPWLMSGRISLENLDIQIPPALPTTFSSRPAITAYA
jgi:type I restriction enzyme, S subunit